MAGPIMPLRSESTTGSRPLFLLAGLLLLVAFYAYIGNVPSRLNSATTAASTFEHSHWLDRSDSLASGERHHRMTSASVFPPIVTESGVTGLFGPGPPLATSERRGTCVEEGPLIALTCSTNEPLPRLLQWIRYNQLIGCTLFYIFVEGRAAEPHSVQYLRSLVGVKVFEQNERLAWWHKHSRAHHEIWLRKFFGQPCNGELFVKQSLNMEVAVHQARVDGAGWIGHIDTDELMYPAGSTNYSLSQVLAEVPARTHGVVLPNYEALPEREDVVDPASEVTLFKVAVEHIDKAAMQANYRAVAHGNPNYFVAYSNGKSLARVAAGLRSHGAHRWSSYNGSFVTTSHAAAAVLHYTYNRFGDLASRRDRCECAPTESDAKRCFWLSFDQQAFVAASLKTEEELRAMFRDRLVWQDPAQVAALRQKGLVDRIYSPQLLMRSVQGVLFQSVPKRSLKQQHEEAKIRDRRDETHHFKYYDGGERPGGECQRFFGMDTSLNILELMGPVDDGAEDSDAVLESRMNKEGGPSLQNGSSPR